MFASDPIASHINGNNLYLYDNTKMIPLTQSDSCGFTFYQTHTPLCVLEKELLRCGNLNSVLSTLRLAP